MVAPQHYMFACRPPAWIGKKKEIIESLLRYCNIADHTRKVFHFTTYKHKNDAIPMHQVFFCLINHDAWQYT